MNFEVTIALITVFAVIVTGVVLTVRATRPRTHPRFPARYIRPRDGSET